MQRLSDTAQKHTAEQLRAMSDDDLSDCAARAVMKWGIVANSNVRPPFKRYFGLQSDEGGDAVDWQFATDDSAAFVLVDKLIAEDFGMQLENVADSDGHVSWRCRIERWKIQYGGRGWLVDGEFYGCSTHRSRAITEACILAAQEVPRA